MSDVLITDKCLSRVANNPEPIDVLEMKPCTSDPHCVEAIKSEPSVAYGLSHRYVFIL